MVDLRFCEEERVSVSHPRNSACAGAFGLESLGTFIFGQVFSADSRLGLLLCGRPGQRQKAENALFSPQNEAVAKLGGAGM